MRYINRLFTYLLFLLERQSKLLQMSDLTCFCALLLGPVHTGDNVEFDQR